jgi:hypothetical protein
MDGLAGMERVGWVAAYQENEDKSRDEALHGRDGNQRIRKDET